MASNARFMQMMRKMEMMEIAVKECQKVAEKLRQELAASQELKDAGIKVPNSPVESHCFHVPLPFSYPASHVSVSVPPDACGNRGDDYNEDEPSTYETALMTAGELMYLDEIGYEGGVRRFETVDEIVEELLRVRAFVE